MEAILGVALGRKYIFAAYVDNDKVQSVNCEGAGAFIPNAISFDSSGILIGMKAVEQVTKNPRYTFTNIHELLGKTQEEIQLMPEAKYWHFKKQKDELFFEVIVNGKTVQRDLLFMQKRVFLYLRTQAQLQSKKAITEMYLARPSYLSTSQIRQIRDAAKMAGFSKVGICPLSLAVARAHWKIYYDREHQKYSNCVMKEVSLDDIYESEVQINKKTFTEVNQKRIYQLSDPKESVNDFDKWMAAAFQVPDEECCRARLALHEGAESFRLSNGEELTVERISKVFVEQSRRLFSEDLPRDTVLLVGGLLENEKCDPFAHISEGKYQFHEYWAPAWGAAVLGDDESGSALQRRERRGIIRSLTVNRADSRQRRGSNEEGSREGSEVERLSPVPDGLNAPDDGTDRTSQRGSNVGVSICSNWHCEIAPECDLADILQTLFGCF
ncbi:hypothetical protein Aperf_G00000116256 [Anoplocephala perfoliata]